MKTHDVIQRRAPWGATGRWLTSVALKWANDDCLLYPFGLGGHGYGQATVDGQKVLAHRFVCAAFNGTPPSAKHDAAHSCGNKRCVNGRHLRWATRTENEADKLGHGRRLRGESHSLAKLTEGQVLAIRSTQGVQRQIAAKYGVTQQTVSDIKRGRRWGWL